MIKNYMLLLSVLVYSTSLFGSAGKHELAQKALAGASAASASSGTAAAPMEIVKETVQWNEELKGVHALSFSPNGKWVIAVCHDLPAASSANSGVKSNPRCRITTTVFSVDQETGILKKFDAKKPYDIGLPLSCFLHFSHDGRMFIVVFCCQSDSQVRSYAFNECTGEMSAEHIAIENRLAYGFCSRTKQLAAYRPHNQERWIDFCTYNDKKNQYDFVTSLKLTANANPDYHTTKILYSPRGEYLALCCCDKDGVILMTFKTDVEPNKYICLDAARSEQLLNVYIKQMKYSSDEKQLIVSFKGLGFECERNDVMLNIGHQGRRITRSSTQGDKLKDEIRLQYSDWHLEIRFLEDELTKSVYEGLYAIRGDQCTKILDKDSIHDVVFSPNENIVIVKSSREKFDGNGTLIAYEFDDEAGTISPLTGAPLQSVQRWRKVQEALSEVLIFGQPEVAAMVRMYIGPRQKTQSATVQLLNDVDQVSEATPLIQAIINGNYVLAHAIANTMTPEARLQSFGDDSAYNAISRRSKLNETISKEGLDARGELSRLLENDRNKSQSAEKQQANKKAGGKRKTFSN